MRCTNRIELSTSKLVDRCYESRFKVYDSEISEWSRLKVCKNVSLYSNYILGKKEILSSLHCSCLHSTPWDSLALHFDFHPYYSYFIITITSR